MTTLSHPIQAVPAVAHARSVADARAVPAHRVQHPGLTRRELRQIVLDIIG